MWKHWHPGCGSVCIRVWKRLEVTVDECRGPQGKVEARTRLRTHCCAQGHGRGRSWGTGQHQLFSGRFSLPLAVPTPPPPPPLAVSGHLCISIGVQHLLRLGFGNFFPVKW